MTYIDRTPCLHSLRVSRAQLDAIRQLNERCTSFPPAPSSQIVKGLFDEEMFISGLREILGDNVIDRFLSQAPISITLVVIEDEETTDQTPII